MESELRLATSADAETGEVDLLALEGAADPFAEFVVPDHAGERGRHSPARQCHQGRRHGPSPLDAESLELTLGVRRRVRGDLDQVVEAALPESKDAIRRFRRAIHDADAIPV
jgi:hypothetical protein